jgi:transcriptional regulator with XRE-family HTH domain
MNLRDVRLAAGLSQEMVAEQLTQKLGKFISFSNYARWERGINAPISDVIIPMAEVFGLDVLTILLALRLSQQEKPTTGRHFKKRRKR